MWLCSYVSVQEPVTTSLTAVPASSTTSIVSASVFVDLTEGVSDIAGVDSEGHLLANALAVIQQISPLPRSKLVRQRKRKTEGAEVVTSFLYKQQLLDKKKTQPETNNKQQPDKNKRLQMSKDVSKRRPEQCEGKKEQGTISG